MQFGPLEMSIQPLILAIQPFIKNRNIDNYKNPIKCLCLPLLLATREERGEGLQPWGCGAFYGYQHSERNS